MQQSGGQPGMAQAQFRQPLPPNAASVGVRIMNPNLQMRPGGPPGQVSGNCNPMATRPGTFLLVQRQPSSPQVRARMMVQPGQPGGQPGLIARPPVSQNSPLLAQHLAGRMPTPAEQQQQQQQVPSQVASQSMQQQGPPQQQQQQGQGHGQSHGQGQGDDLENLDNVPNELGDLGVAEEDLLVMGDNFDILEFADALDDLENNLPEGGDAKKGQTPSSSSSEANITSSSTTTTTTSQSSAVTTPATQPPPYSKTPPTPGVNTGPQTGGGTPGTPVRGPPPPYPGQQPPISTSKVN